MGGALDLKPRISNVTGKTGIYRVQYRKKKTGYLVAYWNALCPGGPNDERSDYTVRFYVTKYGEDEAHALAEEVRQLFVEQYHKGELPQFWETMRERGFIR